MSGGLFISYRREDDPGWVHAILARLEQHIPPQSIFVDVEGIRPGADFVQVLEEKLRDSDVLISVIGPNWLIVTDASGKRRIDDPDDFVRIEIETALRGNKTIMPVLVRSAKLPQAESLPEPLRPMVRRQATSISHERFRSDVQNLVRHVIEALDAARRAGQINTAPETVATSYLSSGRAALRTVFVFALIGALATTTGATIDWSTGGPDFSASLGESMAANLLVALPYTLAWPLACYLSGFRTTRTLLITTLIYAVATLLANVAWELGLAGRISEAFPFERDLAEKAIAVAGWALFIPRFRKPLFLGLAVVLSLLAATSYFVIDSFTESWPLFLRFLAGHFAQNWPLFLLIGYGISRR
jgi:hypothetical protein